MFAMTAQDAPATVDLRKYIEVRLFDDRPHIRGRRIPVATILGVMQANNLSVADTAYNFSISEAEVLAALLYYQEHNNTFANYAAS
jgi:uncharacterized protein (DUF433 family)